MGDLSSLNSLNAEWSPGWSVVPRCSKCGGERLVKQWVGMVNPANGKLVVRRLARMLTPGCQRCGFTGNEPSPDRQEPRSAT